MGNERITTFLLLLNQLMTAGSAVVINILAARVMVPDERGHLALALQICYLAAVFGLMGLERPFIADQQGSFSQQYRFFTRLVTPGFLIVVLLTAVGLAFFRPSSAFILLTVASALYVGKHMLSRGVRVAYVTSGSWKPFVVHGISTALMVVVGALILAGSGLSDPALWMAVYVLSGVIPIYFLVSSILRKEEVPRRKTLDERRLRISGLKLLPAALGNTAMVRSDRLLLPMLASSAELGLYVTVATAMEMAGWPIQQWVDASLRKWATNTRKLKQQMLKHIALAIMVSAIASLVLGGVAYFFIVWILPATYLASTQVIIPLGIAAIIYSVTRVQQGALVALGASGSVSIVETIGWVSAIVSYIVLIPVLGMTGAAYGSIIGYAVCAAAGFVTIGLRFSRLNY